MLREVFDLFEAARAGGTPRVDREAGIVYGVKVLGRSSKNGHEYAQDSLALSLLEGKNVGSNHRARGKDADVEGRFGQLRGAVRRADGWYADLHCLTTHPMTARVMEAAEKMPGLFGLSILGDGRKIRRGGKLVVESVTSLESVDLVADPATVAGLYESQTMKV